MKVLVLGSGAREHALAWKIGRSPLCHTVYLHPGNGGTQTMGIPNLGDVPPRDPQAVARRIAEIGVTLVVVGPEDLLCLGFGDALRAQGVDVVGPDKAASQLETSKVFAKQFMDRAGIPTAAYVVANSADQLKALTDSRNDWPVVLKLDGLAAGKGVVIATSPTDVAAYTKKVWELQAFGPGPHRVVIEDCLRGREVSYIGLCDGKSFVPLASATDYKRVGDGDTGPNTGGMGCVSPSPYLDSKLEAKIRAQVIDRVLSQLERDKMDYRGALYAGIMVDPEGNPRVLEFNTRFGDPETQPTLLRLKSDFLELLVHTAKGTLDKCPTPEWHKQTSLYVVGAAEGYPEKVNCGDRIDGLGKLDSDVTVFFAGVKAEGTDLLTAGGRVLGIGCLKDDFPSVQQHTYRNMERIRWRAMHYRSDIGQVVNKEN